MILGVVVVVAIVLAVGVVVAVLMARRRDPDGVDVFRRQIDALSPEARRPVVDRVQELDHRDGTDADDEPGRS